MDTAATTGAVGATTRMTMSNRITETTENIIRTTTKGTTMITATITIEEATSTGIQRNIKTIKINTTTRTKDTITRSKDTTQRRPRSRSEMTRAVPDTRMSGAIKSKTQNITRTGKQMISLLSIKRD